MARPRAASQTSDAAPSGPLALLQHSSLPSRVTHTRMTALSGAIDTTEILHTRIPQGTHSRSRAWLCTSLGILLVESAPSEAPSRCIPRTSLLTARSGRATYSESRSLARRTQKSSRPSAPLASTERPCFRKPTVSPARSRSGFAAENRNFTPAARATSRSGLKGLFESRGFLQA